MSTLFNNLLLSTFYPTSLPLYAWYDSSNTASVTHAFQNLAATATGTSGATSYTTSGTITNLIQPSEVTKLKGTDSYTVSSASGTTVNIVGTLSTNYVADTIALDKISQWNDLTVGANNFTQATAVNQPVLNPGQMNGKQVFTFDAVASRMLSGSAITLNNDYSIFIVCNAILTITGIMLAGIASNCRIGNTGAGKLFVRAINSGSSDSSLNFPSGINVLNINRDSSNIVTAAFNNGSLNNLFSSAAQSGATTFAELGTDTSNYYGGSIGEIIITSSKLSNYQIAQVYNYLKIKWGTA